MTDSIETSEREAEDPREPIRLPVREMRDEPAPQRAAQEGDLPPLPDHWIPVTFVGLSPLAIARAHEYAEVYARLALAAAGGGVPLGWRDAVMKAADELDMEWQMVEGIFYSLLPSFMADKNEAGFVTIPIDALIEGDSYGVHGSDFYRCKVCGAESGAGMLNKGIEHNFNCPLASSPQPEAAPQWVPCKCFDETSRRLCINKDRCSRAEAYAESPPPEAAPAVAQVPQPAEQVEFLDVQNHQMRRAIHAAMSRLSALLDEDQFAEMEQIFTRAGVAAPEAPAQADENGCVACVTCGQPAQAAPSAGEVERWSIRYDNDTGPGDEGFEQWWSVIDNKSVTRLCRCDTEAGAQMIVAALSHKEPQR